MAITEEDISGILNFINKKNPGRLEVMIMQDSADIRETYVLNRGNYDAKTDVVDFGTPSAILEFDTTKFDRNRYGLA